MKDEIFLRHINQHDIIALLETHCPKDKSVCVPGYFTHQSHVTYHGKREIGGIALLIKTELKHDVTVIKDKEDFIWFKLNKSFFNLERDLYICAAYIPPEQSKYLKHKNDLDILTQITEDIANFSENGHILLMGDLNARTAEMQDYISEDSDKFLSTDTTDYRVDQQLGRRLSQDKLQNVPLRGKQLIDLCVQSRLRILNGRCLGDTFGYFTCHKSNGSSVVDYMIVNEELLNRIVYFKVHPLAGTLSDHCMISLLLKSNFNTLNTGRQNTLSAGPIYLWKDGDVAKFQEALASPDIQKRIDVVLNTKYYTCKDSHLAVKDLCNILIGAAKNTLTQTHTNAKNKKKANKPWYDKSLSTMRKEVGKKAQLLSQFPHDPFIRGSYYKSLKQYNKSRKYKQRTHKQNIVHKLDQMRTEKPSEFWKLLKLLKMEDSQDNPATNISLTEWG